jgi:hypothetical protein
MANITGIQITELAEAVISFDAPIDPEEMSSGQLWDLEPQLAVSAFSSVYDAEALGGFQLVKVWFSPWLSPTQDYIITAYPGGVATNLTFTAPNLQKELGPEWYHGALKAISRTCGQMVQEFVGKPETILTEGIRNTDKHIFVESTLGFPPTNGYFFVAEREYRYTEKRPSSFRNVTADENMNWVQTPHQRVTVNQARILPYNSKPFLDASGDGSNGVL